MFYSLKVIKLIQLTISDWLNESSHGFKWLSIYIMMN